ncbi:MAG: four helix bundle protein [Candidatus Doudnabacteria bacterium]|nr:four helix bundle protein [Candidatus Doudnabacteria bacterium]
MTAVKQFSELLVWQKAHALTLEAYSLSGLYPKSEIFGLSSQSRRAAVSVPSNIAEGFKRKTKTDSLHFYTVAEGSLEELKYQLLLAQDLSYITKEQYDRVMALAEDVGRLLHGWKRIQK